MKGFADSEAEPDEEEFRQRVALRRAEMSGEGRFLLARVSGESASVLGFYEGDDRFIFSLATRLTFRGLASRAGCFRRSWRARKSAVAARRS